jgi:hypothetical protein
VLARAAAPAPARARGCAASAGGRSPGCWRCGRSRCWGSSALERRRFSQILEERHLDHVAGLLEVAEDAVDDLDQRLGLASISSSSAASSPVRGAQRARRDRTPRGGRRVTGGWSRRARARDSPLVPEVYGAGRRSVQVERTGRGRRAGPAESPPNGRLYCLAAFSRPRSAVAAPRMPSMWLLYQLGLAPACPRRALPARPRGRHYLPTLRGRLARERGWPGGAPAVDPRGVGRRGGGRRHAGAGAAPRPALLLTTVTPTGQARAGQLLGPRPAEVAYLPFDLSPPVRRFLDRFAPAAWSSSRATTGRSCCATRLRRREVPVRRGQRPGRRPQLRADAPAAPAARPALSGVDRFGVQTAEDRDRLARLGVEESGWRSPAT